MLVSSVDKLQKLLIPNVYHLNYLYCSHCIGDYRTGTVGDYIQYLLKLFVALCSLIVLLFIGE